MFIRKVTKKNKNSNKAYHYYRLTHSYRVGSKTRQQVLLNLGTLEGLEKEDHKKLADRIEEIVTGTSSIFPLDDQHIESLAQTYAVELMKKKIFPSSNTEGTISKPIEKQWHEVDIDSIEEEECLELGGEWLCKQSFEKLGLPELFAKCGMDNPGIAIGQALLTAKMIHPSSELETERWLKENSSTMELYGENTTTPTRYRLYKAAEHLYTHKEVIEKHLYQICSNLFTQRNKIVIFDVTNMYFEGVMEGSKKAAFGRSKEKRSDCRLISLSLAIDSLGFVRHSQLWQGNVSEPKTLEPILANIANHFDRSLETPTVVMDAGIATEDNLKMIKEKGYDYVCVSRSLPKEYKKLTDNATILYDNRDNKIYVQKIQPTNTDDTFLYVKSEQKAKKEQSIDNKLTQRFEERLIYLKDGLGKPRRLKKTVSVHEHVGKLRRQFSKVAKLYEINYTEDKVQGKVTDITWKRIKEKEKPKGHYFLRYSKQNLTDKQVWDVYNMTREVEASFRCLKTDLNIRPIHHQVDHYIEPHIWLGVIAYQVVNYIRIQLDSNGIGYSWSKIVQKMKTQKQSLVTMNSKNDGKIFAKLCTRPNKDVKNIYNALGFKDRPFVRKTKVVTQL